MWVGTGAIGVLQEDVKVSLAVNKYLILYDASFFQIFQLGEGEFFIVELKNALGLFGGHGQPTEY